MFSYYGSKTDLVKHYPVPKYDRIIEPFAGAAKYSLKYYDRDITLIEKYEVLVRIWNWLQECDPEDVLKLPILKKGQDLRDFKFDCDEARLFMGFVVAPACFSPANIASVRCTTQRPKTIGSSLKKVADNLYKIKNWKIVHGNYTLAYNKKATWFIDPPYQNGGHKYVHSNKFINYKKLATWCKSRKGQTIVCENVEADWMNFKPIVQIKGNSNKKYVEGIWTNLPSQYDNIQQKLIL